MTEPYSFEDTDALLASLSSSSVPTLSPTDLSNISGKSSSYGLSPDNQNLFGVDSWDTFGGSEESGKDIQADEFLTFDTGNEQPQATSQQNGFNSDEFAGQTFGMSYSDGPASGSSYQSDDMSSSQTHQQGYTTREIKTEQDSSPESFKTSPPNSSKNRISKPSKKDRSSHNIIEKKYRTNINDKLGNLRDAVPALRMAAGHTDTTINDLDGLTPASKLNKGVILTKATEYIKHLERKNHALLMETQRLRQMIQGQGQMYPQFQQPQVPPQQVPPQSMYTTPPPQSMSLSQFQPAQDFAGQPVNVVSAQQPQPQYGMGMPGKVIMGGLATMMGQQMFAGSDGFDQRGLSAFPILGLPQFSVFFNVVKFMFLAMAGVYIFVPSVFYMMSDSDNTDAKKPKKKPLDIKAFYTVLKELVFIAVDQKKRKDVTDVEISALLNRELIGCIEQQTSCCYSVLYLLLKLHTYNPTFEVSFGKMVLAKLLLSYSDMAALLQMNSVVQHSIKEISNQKVSQTNLRYFFKELSTANGQKSESFKRFYNIIAGLPLHLNCTRGVNDKGYDLILKDQRVYYDYKNLLVSLRANELFREVLLKYVHLTFNQGAVSKLANEELKDMKKEIWDLLNLAEHFAPERSIVQIRIKLFKSILNEKYVDAVLKLVNEEALQSTDTLVPESLSVETLKSDVQDADVYASDQSDVEATSVPSSPKEKAVAPLEDTADATENSDDVSDMSEDEEDVADEDDDTLSATQTPVRRSSSIQIDTRFQKMLTQDLSNALTAASVLKYIRAGKREECRALLKYIKAHKDEITILSFISMFKVVQKYPKEWLSSGSELDEVIEPLLAQLRLWVGDSENTNFDDVEDGGLQVKMEISDQLVQAGKSFSEVE